MARPKSFDPDDVLEQVMDVFWSRGYAATGIADLEEATGLGRQSLYSTFGDKHAMFVQALDRYAAHGQHDAIRLLYEAPGGLPAIRRYFEALVDFLHDTAPRKSCLMVNTMLELGATDRAVAASCHGNTAALIRGFTAALTAADGAGALRPGARVPVLARLLVSQSYGLSVLSANGATRSELNAVVDVLLHHLHR